MNPEQIKNWRDILLLTLGPYALIMPEEEIIKIKENMQDHILLGLFQSKILKIGEKRS